MSETSGGGTSNIVPKELASLVPGFDPSVDNVEIWTSKVELLLTTWPPDKLNELATRLILGCKGTAYQKLQLLRSEVLTNSDKGIRRLVEIVGGTWGQIPLEKKFELAERALFRSSQKSDETSDSYLSRCDVTWTELLSKKVDLNELQAYIALRGSKLGADDKKRVIVESKAEEGSQLTMEKVTSAIRLLGSGFFQEYTGIRRDKTGKTYDHTALHVDDDYEGDGETYAMNDELPEDELLEVLAAENDEDAILVMQFEDSIADTIQADSELCAYYSAYQEARRRLSERVKVRGFWPVTKRFDKGAGKKGKGKGKGRHPFGGSGSLARRIANSFCRICMQKGHWKNECPQRNQQNTSASSTNASSTAPTSFVIVEEVPEEISHLAVTEAKDSDQVQYCFGVNCRNWGNQGNNWGKLGVKGMKFATRFADQWRHALRTMMSSDETPPEFTHPDQPKSASVVDESPESCMEANFVTTGTMGIVDLGASQTVIGDKQVPELLQQLPTEIRNQVKRTSCNLTFRFGNQQTLSCKHALLLPLGTAQFRIAIVPGRTPFLLSSSFLKGIKAIIDTEHGSLWSKLLQRELTVEGTSKNLLMMDLNQLWCEKSCEQSAQQLPSCGLIFQSAEEEKPMTDRHSSPVQCPKGVRHVRFQNQTQHMTPQVKCQAW